MAAYSWKANVAAFPELKTHEADTSILSENLRVAVIFTSCLRSYFAGNRFPLLMMFPGRSKIRSDFAHVYPIHPVVLPNERWARNSIPYAIPRPMLTLSSQFVEAPMNEAPSLYSNRLSIVL